nr:single-stranded DNA-binding protein [Geodermatophilus sabuli]
MPVPQQPGGTARGCPSTGPAGVHRCPGRAAAPSCGDRSSSVSRHPAGRAAPAHQTPRSTVNDTIVTVVGNVVDAPRRFRPESGSPVTNFRMASTSRRFDNRSQEFVDGATFWVDVECWNDLSGNVSGSVSKGDPVIVHGQLSTHSWETDSGRRSIPRIKASAVGPNLAAGRRSSSAAGPPAAPTSGTRACRLPRPPAPPETASRATARCRWPGGTTWRAPGRCTR